MLCWYLGHSANSIVSNSSLTLLSRHFEGAASAQFFQVLADAPIFALQKALYCSSEFGLRQPVRTAGLDRQQCARHFVFALGAAFEALVALRYAPLQRLVVAGFKVQAVDSFQRAPVATVGRWRCAAAATRRFRFIPPMALS